MKKEHASLTSALMREMIRAAVASPWMKSDGLIRAGADHAKTKSVWKAPKGYSLEKIDAGGLPMELLARDGGRSDMAVLQLHGGAYMIGLNDLYRRIAVRYSKMTSGAPVLTIDYRIAPTHTFPAALDDAVTAWKWLLGRGFRASRILVAGDSAGGNLALALTLKLRELGMEMPGALVLMSPWADMTGTGDSHTSNYARDPMFGRSARGRGGVGNAYAGGTELSNPLLSPVFAEYGGFPPMLIQAGTWEMLLSDAVTVAQKARAAGADVTLTEYEGMFHVFQAFGSLLPESRAAWLETEQFISDKFPKL